MKKAFLLVPILSCGHTGPEALAMIGAVTDSATAGWFESLLTSVQ